MTDLLAPFHPGEGVHRRYLVRREFLLQLEGLRTGGRDRETGENLSQDVDRVEVERPEPFPLPPGVAPTTSRGSDWIFQV